MQILIACVFRAAAATVELLSGRSPLRPCNEQGVMWIGLATSQTCDDLSLKRKHFAQSGAKCGAVAQSAIQSAHQPD